MNRQKKQALLDEIDSLKEALEIAQGEIVRLKTTTRDIKDHYDGTIEDASRAMEQSNSAKDKVLVMAGTLNRAREVAGAMKTPLRLINDAIPQLPAPTNEDEEQALSNITESMVRLIRYSGMISNDGKGVEDLRISKALDEDREKRGLPLLSGPENKKNG